MYVAGLIFDVEDVLYDATCWQRWLLRQLSRLGLHTHYQAFFRVWEREYLDEVHCGGCDYWEAMRAYLASAGLAKGQIDEVIAASRTRYERSQHQHTPLPDARQTIARLAASGVALGILINSPSPTSHILQRLRSLGFGSPFRVAFSSFDLRRTMPQKEVYQTALSAMQLPASVVGFVGHSAAELSGASKLGMPTIAFNFNPDVRADVYLERLSDLFSAVTLKAPGMLAG